MEENNNEDEKELSQEEKLEQANKNAENLIKELETKKTEYANLLKELTEKKEQIDDVLDEINTTKQTFINNTNNKLEEYTKTFEVKTSDITNYKTKSEEIFKTLDSQYKALVEKHKTDADAQILEMTTKVKEMSDKLNKEKTDFDKFLKDNKIDYEQQYEKIKTLVSQYKVSTTESLAYIQAKLDESTNNAANIKKMDAEMKAYKSSVDEYVNKMNDTTEAIEERVKNYNEKTQKIIEQNNQQTIEVSRQLELATGAGLFTSFNKRKNDLDKSQWIWLIILLLSISAFIWYAFWLTNQLKEINWENFNWFIDIFLKVSASTPFLYLVAFVTDRYTKERRLLEEYAFKSTISLSLKPYFDMVSNNNIKNEDREFLIESIKNIFTTPTDKVYRTKECQNKVDVNHFSEQIGELIKSKINEDKK